LVMLWRTWRHGTLEQRLLAVACAGAIGGFALYNQFGAGYVWRAPAIALAFVAAIFARNYLEHAERRELRSVASGAPSMAAWGVAARRYMPLAARAALVALLIVPFVAWYR